MNSILESAQERLRRREHKSPKRQLRHALLKFLQANPEYSPQRCSEFCVEHGLSEDQFNLLLYRQALEYLSPKQEVSRHAPPQLSMDIEKLSGLRLLDSCDVIGAYEFLLALTEDVDVKKIEQRISARYPYRFIATFQTEHMGNKVLAVLLMRD